MIAGTVKEVVTVITAVIVFHDKFGLINGVGLMIVIAGVLLFNWYKLQKLKQAIRERIVSRESSIDLSAEGVPIHMVADSSSRGSPTRDVNRNSASPRAVLAVANLLNASGSPRTASNGHSHARGHDRLSFNRHRSSVDEQEVEDVMKTLEFEPLLPLRV